MARKKQQQRRPSPHTRQYQVVDQEGNIIATSTSSREASELAAQQEGLRVQRGQELIREAPEAGEVTEALQTEQEQVRHFEQARQQFESDLEVVRPYQDAEGRIDVVAALEGGVSQEVLNRLIPAESVAQGESIRQALQEIAPYRADDGQIDLVAALEGGVSPETLSRLFEGESLQRAQSLQTARAELGDRSPVEFIQQGGAPDFLLTLGLDQDVVDALVEVRPHLTAEGNVNATAALQAGVSRETLQVLGITPREPTIFEQPPPTIQPDHINRLKREIANAQHAILRGVSEGQDLDNAMMLARRREAEFWREFGFDVAGLRSAYESQDRWYPRAIASSEQRIAGLRRNPPVTKSGRPISRENADAAIARLQERINQLRQEQAANRQAMRDFDAYVRALRPVIQETIDDSLQAVPQIVAGTGGRPGIPSPDAAQPVAISFEGIPAGPDIPGATAALERAGLPVSPVRQYVIVDPNTGQQVGVTQDPQAAIDQGFSVRPAREEELTRPPDAFQILDPATGESRGFASGEQAIEAARAQGFDVVPVRRVTRPLTPAEVREQEPEARFQIRDSQGRSVGFAADDAAIQAALDQGFDVVPVTITRPVGEEARTATPPLVAQVDTSELVQRGLDITRLPDGSVEVDMVAALDGGFEDELRELGFTEPQIAEGWRRVQAYQGLVNQGFASSVGGGVDVAGAADAGLQPLLIQAGFKAPQIEQARQEQFQAEVSQRRFIRQVFDPGQRLALDQLEQQGLADDSGNIDIFRVIETGQQGLALQAGLTPSQINRYERDYANMLLALEGGMPGEISPTGLPQSVAFPVGAPRTTELATPEAVEAAAQRQEEIDAELLGLRGILREIDEGSRGPEIRLQTQQAINRLAEEKDRLNQAAIEQFQQIWEGIRNDPAFRPAIPDAPTPTFAEAVESGLLQGPLPVGGVGTGALPVTGPGLPGAAVATAALALITVGAEAARRNPQVFESTRREQVRPGDVSPPAFPQVRPDVELPGFPTARGIDLSPPGFPLQQPPELRDIAPGRVSVDPSPPGTALTVPPEVVTVLNMAADVVETEREISQSLRDADPLVRAQIEAVLRHQDPSTTPAPRIQLIRGEPVPVPVLADVPPAFGSDIFDPFPAGFTRPRQISVPLDTLIDSALATDEERRRFRSRLSELDRRRLLLQQAQLSLVMSQGFSPRDRNNPEILAAATAAAFESAERRGPGTTPERGPGPSTLPTREVSAPGRPERPDVRDIPQVFDDTAIGIPLEEGAQPWVITIQELNQQAERGNQLQQQLSVTPTASLRTELVSNLQQQLRLTNELQNQLALQQQLASQQQLALQPALANELSLSNQLGLNLQQQLALQQELALNPALANEQALQNELAQQTAIQNALRTQLTTATQTLTTTTTATQARTRAQTRTRTQTRTRARTTTARVPAVTTTTTTLPPGFPPDSDGLDRDAQGRLNLREVGISRGAVGDTSIDLVDGETRTVKDIQAVPSLPTKETFVPLEFSEDVPSPQKIRWGFLDLIVAPDGTKTFLKHEKSKPKPKNLTPSIRRPRL